MLIRLWVLLLNYILHLYPTCLLNKNIYLFHRYPITNIQMQISIKPICDWRIYLTASADERLACLKQTSFLIATSIMDSLLAIVTQNELLPTLFLHAQQGHLPYSSTLSFIPQPNITFVSNSSSNPGFHTVLSRRLSSLSDINCRSDTFSNTRGKPAHGSLAINSITMTNSRELNADP